MERLRQVVDSLIDTVPQQTRVDLSIVDYPAVLHVLSYYD